MSGGIQFMASQKKKNKLKNAYAWKGALKSKFPAKLKRGLFYTSSERKRLNEGKSEV